MDIENLRSFCLSMPGVTEDVKWEVHLAFCVYKKIFCMADLEGGFGVGFKTDEETFEELTQRNGIIPAPHLARAQWVKVMEPLALNKKEWELLLRKSYELISAKLTKKQKMELGLL
jgi:predicted DNA-binding protein (MmcQ/YjbR family)